MLKIGHRGAMGYAPENTMKSFEKALELGVDVIEVDVHRAKSGEIVVIHDETVTRTMGREGEVAKMTLRELQALDAGAGERIPTLSQVLDYVNRRAKINIEIKNIGFAADMLKIIKHFVEKKNWSYEDFFVCSFIHPELRFIKELEPRVRISPLIMGLPETYAEFGEKLGAFSVNMDFEFINQEFVDDAHRRGIQVFAWTVNEPQDIARMKILGVDGIISDFPDRI